MPRPGGFGINVKGTLLPLIFFTVFFIANAVLGYVSIGNLAGNQERANAVRATIGQIDSLHIAILRAETGQRGYLLTRVDSYAAPFYEAASSIEQKLMGLGAAALDAEQFNRFYELQTVTNEKLAELTATMTALEAGRYEEAMQLMLRHRGRDLMVEIAALASAMQQHEHNLLQQRTQEVADSRLTALALILAANIVGLVMVFVSRALIRSNLQKEQEFLQSLQEANDNLELKVDQRTAVLQHYSNELNRSNRELQDFAFVASHDLQEPLRKIRAFGDRLQQNFGPHLGEQGTDYVRRMQNASARMSSLIEDLLAFSRITTKAKPFLPVSLNKVAEEVLEDLEIAIDEADAEISIGELPEIAADQFQMKQLFQNLLGNALKFRRPDSPLNISVTAELSTPDGSVGSTRPPQVKLHFSDNGIGFDEAFLDRIFMPFQRLHGRNEYPGTGIGLAVCRRIVERHGGTLSATSMPGDGSTFTITLPLRNQPHAPGDTP